MSEPANGPPMHSESLGKIAAALAKAQADFGTIERTKTVNVKSDKGNYSFNYSPLDVVLEAVRPALAANELALTQLIVAAAKGPSLRTLLLHSSGEWLAGEVELGARPAKAQELGSLLTYLRRYSIVSILGVATEEDDDGNAADGNAATKAKAAARREKPAQETPHTERAATAPLTASERSVLALLEEEFAAMDPDEIRTWASVEAAKTEAESPAFAKAKWERYFTVFGEKVAKFGVGAGTTVEGEKSRVRELIRGTKSGGPA